MVIGRGSHPPRTRWVRQLEDAGAESRGIVWEHPLDPAGTGDGLFCFSSFPSSDIRYFGSRRKGFATIVEKWLIRVEGLRSPAALTIRAR